MRRRYVRKGGSLVEQPASSPELNPAERIGEAMRAKTEGKVSGTIWKKLAVEEACLRELAADPERVKRLVGWDWIIQSLKQLPWKRKGSSTRDTTRIKKINTNNNRWNEEYFHEYSRELRDCIAIYAIIP